MLALDGDEIGKWVSGEKTPKFCHQLAQYDDGSGNPDGALAYFESTRNPDGRGTHASRFSRFLGTQRPLSPSYHLQFSEALANFALRCVDPIVRAYHGQLIYAGGDDVVAVLPADSAVACAVALRAAFRGHAPGVEGIESPSPGFLTLTFTGHQDQSRRAIPFIVPGPDADCSVGIAMAHFKSPLQDVVRAAQAAEKRAKRSRERGGLGRSAVAVSLFKRSGEILEWGANWDDGGLALFDAILNAMLVQELSAKFPHRACELLEPYRTDPAALILEANTFADDPEFESAFDEIVRCEFGHALARQHGPKWPENKELRGALTLKLTGALDGHLQELGRIKLQAQHKLQRLTGLLSAVAFAHRARSDDVAFETGSTP